MGIRVPNAAEDLHEINTRDEPVEGHGDDGDDAHRDDGPKVHEPDPRQLNVLAAGGFDHAQAQLFRVDILRGARGITDGGFLQVRNQFTQLVRGQALLGDRHRLID
ncbi:MAG: hypothetical protein VW780_07680 [Actinomycetota bacterium]